MYYVISHYDEYQEYETAEAAEAACRKEFIDGVLVKAIADFKFVRQDPVLVKTPL